MDKEVKNSENTLKPILKFQVNGAIDLSVMIENCCETSRKPVINNTNKKRKNTKSQPLQEEILPHQRTKLRLPDAPLKMGLDSLSTYYLARPLDKSIDIRSSDWEQNYLTGRQVHCDLIFY